MVAKHNFLFKLSYSVRLLAAIFHLLFLPFSLLRLAYLDASCIKEVCSLLRNRNYSAPSPWSVSSFILPIRYWLKAFRNVPIYAGRKLQKHRDNILFIYKYVNDYLDHHRTSRYALPHGPARNLQATLILSLFRKYFSLYLSEDDVKTLSCYSSVSELLRDFLGYCISNNLPEHPLSFYDAVADFSKQLRKTGETTNQLPPKDFFLKTSHPGSWLFKKSIWHPFSAMVAIYDTKAITARILSSTNEPSWLHACLMNHFNQIQPITIRNFSDLLTFEMHILSCNILLKIASSQPAAHEQLRESFTKSFDTLRRNFRKLLNNTRTNL